MILCYGRVYQGFHASFVELVPFKYIFLFTLFQIAYFLLCFGITWIPIAGILFPLPFFLLISIREHILPKLFPIDYLQQLDASEYEEVIGRSFRSRSLSLKVCMHVTIHHYLIVLVITLWNDSCYQLYSKTILNENNPSLFSWNMLNINADICEKQDRDTTDADTDEDESVDLSAAEILDEITTRRGELKHRQVSFNSRQVSFNDRQVSFNNRQQNQVG